MARSTLESEPMEEGFPRPEMNECDDFSDFYASGRRVSNKFSWVMNGSRIARDNLSDKLSAHLFDLAEKHAGETLVTVFADFDRAKYAFFKRGKEPGSLRDFLAFLKKGVWIESIETDAHDRYRAFVYDSERECGKNDAAYWHEIGLDTPAKEYRQQRNTKMGKLATIDFYLSQRYRLPERLCNRCGTCCWAYEMHSISYGARYNNEKLRRNKGLSKYRCPNLEFDAKEGVYSCSATGEWPEICKGYHCGYMDGNRRVELGLDIEGLPPYDIGKFGDVPEFGSCKTCDPIDLLPVNVEWFIAFARKHPGSPLIAGKGAELKKQIGKAAASKRMDAKWAKELLLGLDGVLKARCKRA